MPRIADYKVLNDDVTRIDANQSTTFSFELGGQIAQGRAGQRPFLSISEKIGGALPGTLNITLNGSIIDIREGDANNPLSGGYPATHTVIFDGALLIVGSNTLTFDVNSTVNTNLEVGALILHFQRDF